MPANASRRPRTSGRFVKLVVAILAFVAWSVAQSGESLPRATPEDVGMSGERLARLTKAMNAYVEADRLPGAVVTVVRQGRIA